MRFSVPQFTTIEDKLLGFVTFRQLFLLLGAFLITYVAFKYLPLVLAVIVALVAAVVAAALGWIQINGKSLLMSLPEVISFIVAGRKQYIWRPLNQMETREIEIPIIEKYFPLNEDALAFDGVKFTERTPYLAPPIVAREEMIAKKSPAVGQAPPPVRPTVAAPVIVPQPLARYIQYSHRHLVNPQNPYRHFPLPSFSHQLGSSL